MTLRGKKRIQNLKTGKARKQGQRGGLKTKSEPNQDSKIVLIPKALKDAIEKLGSHPKSESCCLNMACYIYKLYQNRFDKDSYFIPISKKQFMANVSTDYFTIKERLICSKIIESNNFYWYVTGENKEGRKGQCLKYKISPNLLSGESVYVKYKNKPRKYSDDPIVQETLKELKNLSIIVNGQTIYNDESGIKSIEAYVKEQINDDSVLQKFKINSLLPEETYEYCNWDSTQHIASPVQHKKGDDLLKNKGEDDLILYKNKVYIANKQKFLEFKVEDLRTRAINSLLAILCKDWVCSRCETNRRLDHNMTNLKGEFIKLLHYEGESFVSMDLKNSQFLILAHLLEACWNFILCKNIVKEEGCKLLTKPQIPLSFKEYEFKGKTILEGVIKREYGKVWLEEILDILCQVSLLSSVNNSNSMSYDILTYMKLTKRGVFYPIFGKILMQDSEKDNNSCLDTHCGVERSVINERELGLLEQELGSLTKEKLDKLKAPAKAAMFHIAFSNRNSPLTVETRLFETTFPKLAELIKEFKKKIEKIYIPRYLNEERERVSIEIKKLRDLDDYVLASIELKTGELIDKAIANASNRGIRDEAIKKMVEANSQNTETNTLILNEVYKINNRIIKAVNKNAVDDANASFAVMLQNIESTIFIDDILPKLWKAGFKGFTKHDSFLVKKSQEKEAEAFIRLEFNKIFGENEYQLAIEQ